MSKTKTVFFLGAGFSKDAGGPIQNELIETILSDDFYSFNDENVRKAIDKFKSFLSNELYFDESQNSKVVLEDVFTPIDRCISEAKSFGTYSYKELIGFRELLHNLLARAIQYGVDQPGHSKSYIDEFAKYLNEQSKAKLEHPQSDKVSVITTNWDILLDNSLFDLTSRESQKLNDLYSDRVNPPLAVVDYCCYISSLDKDELIKPGLLAIGRSGYNIKYLKLHGSMNWLHCPYCQRLYVKFHEKTMFEKHYCIHCKRNFNLKDNNAIKLRANLLMPTFLKDYNDVQTKLIWQNAAIELSEAKRVVFMGYSLPFADFEIRQLLSRFISSETEIVVVLHPKSSTIDTDKDRYRNFFGRRKMLFYVKSIPDFIRDDLNSL